MVFPTKDDWHKLGILYLKSESDQVGEDIERLATVARASDVSDDYGVTVIQELVTNGLGTLAASPISYDGLSEQDRLTILGLIVARTVGVDLVNSIAQQSSRSGRRRR